MQLNNFRVLLSFMYPKFHARMFCFSSICLAGDIHPAGDAVSFSLVLRPNMFAACYPFPLLTAKS